MSELYDLEKAREQSEKYSINRMCQNCGKTSTFVIPKGVLVQDASTKCPSCGCSEAQLHEFFRRKQEPSL